MDLHLTVFTVMSMDQKRVKLGLLILRVPTCHERKIFLNTMMSFTRSFRVQKYVYKKRARQLFQFPDV